MKRVEIKDVKPYDAAGHFNMTAMRLSGEEETGNKKFWMGLSHFLPGAARTWLASPTEKVYFVLEGEISRRYTGFGDAFEEADSIFMGLTSRGRL